MINYRPELSDDKIKEILQDPTKPWIGKESKGIIKYLCDKVNLEMSVFGEKAGYQILLDEACH